MAGNGVMLHTGTHCNQFYDPEVGNTDRGGDYRFRPIKELWPDHGNGRGRVVTERESGKALGWSPCNDSC